MKKKDEKLMKVTKINPYFGKGLDEVSSRQKRRKVLIN